VGAPSSLDASKLKDTDEPDERASRISSTSSQIDGDTPTTQRPADSQLHLFTSVSFGQVTATEDTLPESYMLRRRVDKEQRIGMDISDANLESSFRPQPHSILEAETSENTESASSNQEQQLRGGFILKQVRFAESNELRASLWAMNIFKFYVFVVFGALRLIIITYGI
jgi:hypothetical protein